MRAKLGEKSLPQDRVMYHGEMKKPASEHDFRRLHNHSGCSEAVARMVRGDASPLAPQTPRS